MLAGMGAYEKNGAGRENKGFSIIDRENKGLSKLGRENKGLNSPLGVSRSQLKLPRALKKKSDPKNKGLSEIDPENKGVSDMIMITKDLAILVFKDTANVLLKIKRRSLWLRL